MRKREFFLITVIMVAVVGAPSLFASRADAIGTGIAISGTGGVGVNIRPTPDTSRTPLGRIPDGVSPDYICFTHGQMIYTVNVWFKVIYRGVTGYYASYYDNSSYSSDSNLTLKYGVPNCGSGYTYNRGAAVNWALAHARDAQPNGSACARFASLALWAGGLRRTYDWTDANGGTSAYTNVIVQSAYLSGKYPQSTFLDITSRFRTNAVSEAAVGDLITYDWENDGHRDHVAVVTSIASGSYPNVSEWGNVDAGGQSSSYTSRGWTWSERYHQWLQQKYPNVHAMLIHVVPY